MNSRNTESWYIRYSHQIETSALFAALMITLGVMLDANALFIKISIIAGIIILIPKLIMMRKMGRFTILRKSKNVCNNNDI